MSAHRSLLGVNRTYRRLDWLSGFFAFATASLSNAGPCGDASRRSFATHWRSAGRSDFAPRGSEWVAAERSLHMISRFLRPSRRNDTDIRFARKRPGARGQPADSDRDQYSESGPLVRKFSVPCNCRITKSRFSVVLTIRSASMGKCAGARIKKARCPSNPIRRK